MAKTIDVPPLIDGLKDTNIVQKSLPLLSLWKSDLTLSEFKILDTYLSRINSHKPDDRAITFGKGELEKLLGITKINQKDLESRLTNLMSSVIKVIDGRTNKGFKLISLFSLADCSKDENDCWQVELSFTQEAMEYFFNIEEIGYLRYKLRSIINISSRYSYIFFIWLENNRFRKCFDIDLEDLKQVLNCNDNSYSEFKIFNNRILKKCQKELEEKTDIRYFYEPIKKGRKVVAIRFTIETLTDFVKEYQVSES